MKYEFIKTHCLSKKGAKEEHKEDWGAVLFKVHDKMFALVGKDAEGRPIVSLKHRPEQGEEWREQYTDIFPGYYLNKAHWSSVLLNGHVPEAVLKHMLDESYALVFHGLSKKLQKEITNT